MITKLSSIDTEASPNEDKRRISQDLQMMHDKTMESFPQLPVRDCVKPSDESYDMRMESQPESPSQGGYKTLVKSLRSTDETQRANDDTVREPPPAHDKASVSDDILRESPHAHDQESVCDVGLRELPHTPYQDSVCDVGLRELPHTQNQEIVVVREHTHAQPEEGESIEQILSEFDKYLGPLEHGCSGRRSQVPKAWYRMQESERRAIVSRIRSAMDSMGLDEVQRMFKKDKHFLKYADVLNAVRRERIITCSCGKKIQTYRQTGTWDHANCK